MTFTRRETIIGGAAAMLSPMAAGNAGTTMTRTDLILSNAKVATLDRENPDAQAIAIRDGKFLAVGSEQDVRAAAPDAVVIDVGGRRIIPGLIDSHMHIIRGGLNYNMELR